MLVLTVSVLGNSGVCYGKEQEPETAPVYGKDIKDGSYEVEVESSSSMFRIVKARLNVEKGDMTADITLSGKGYLKLFMGTGKVAEEAGEDRYIPYVEDEEGAYTYRIPVEALNVEFSCAAYSKRKETWYDRELVIRSSALPEDAFWAEIGGAEGEVKEQGAKEQTAKELKTKEQDTKEPEKTDALTPVVLDREDGEYKIEVSLKGGTGRASITSPAVVRVSGGAGVAVIEWSSPDFDYMVFEGERYLPVNSQGNSVFEIPVLALDKEIDVIADTVAMSSPYEILYTIVFHGDTMRKNGGERGRLAVVLVLAVAAAGVSGYVFRYRHRRKHDGDA